MGKITAPPPPAKKKSAFDLSDLEGLDLKEIATGKVKPVPVAAADSGQPLQLPIDKIVEDPDQPRKTFDPEKLAELAASVRARGINTPISVKPMDKKGFYMINHGARRYRAAIIAGLKNVPAFIDSRHTILDQIAENLQRDNLPAMEQAAAVAAALALGIKAVDLANASGKGRAWTTKFATIATAPAFVADAANAGKIDSHDAIYDLVVFLEKRPAAADSTRDFLASSAFFTRAAVLAFVKNGGAVPVPKTAEIVSTAKQNAAGGDTGGDAANEPSGETKTEPTRVSTSEQQAAAAEQHQTDTFFRKAQEDDNGTQGTDTSKTRKPTNGTTTAAIHSGFDQGRGESEPKTAAEAVTTPIKKAVLMFTKGARGGTVNLELATDYGFLMVRFEGDEKDSQVRADGILLTALIDS